MDFQAFVDMSVMPCAVLSVERTQDDHAGDIHILKANRAYKEMMGASYRDGMLYSELVPKDSKFEDFCYRTAFLHKKMHAYIHPNGSPYWIDQTTVPLAGDGDNVGYCGFFLELTAGADAERMSKVSLETASAVIKSCITLRGAVDFPASLDAVVADLQAWTAACSCCIVMVNDVMRDVHMLSEKSCGDKTKMQNVPPFSYELVHSWEATVSESSCIIIKDENDMHALFERNPAWCESLQNAGIKTLMLTPLLQGKKIIGYLFVTDFDTLRLVEIKELIELTSFFLASEIANWDLMVRLEILSCIDSLTGVKNRNAMNQRVDLHVSGENPVGTPYGIVFADLNGLKQVNDSGGHEEGDKLIRAGAELLSDVFAGDEIYRAGGDEFVVIVPKCTEEDFSAKVTDLRRRSDSTGQVSFAIGSHWERSGLLLRQAMHLADERMYDDKAAYYNIHTDNRRR